MINKLMCFKSNILRSRLKVVRTSRKLVPVTDNNEKYFDHYYVDTPSTMIDDLTDLDLSNPWAIKRVKYKGKYLR